MFHGKHQKKSITKKIKIMSNLEKFLSIAKANPEGFTIKLNGEAVTSGYCVAVAETQDSFGEEGLEKVLQYAEANGTAIGGWLNHENGEYYFDAVQIIADREEAVKIGVANEQIAIFHLDTLECINL